MSAPSSTREIIGALHNHLDLSGNGTFAIHQTGMSWHCAGAERFLASAGMWQARYRATTFESFHHSEELHYVDEFRGGRLIVTARQRVGESVFLHGAETELRFSGIPVDREPLLALCKRTGNRDAMLTLCNKKYFDEMRFGPDRKTLEALGLILSSRFPAERVVCGIIAKNPFFGKAAVLKKAGVPAGSPIEYLSGVEILCCALKDWHDEEDAIDEYYLTGIQSKWLGHALVMMPTCTWRNITNRRGVRDAPNTLTKTGSIRRRVIKNRTR